MASCLHHTLYSVPRVATAATVSPACFLLCSFATQVRTLPACLGTIAGQVRGSLGRTVSQEPRKAGRPPQLQSGKALGGLSR